MSNNELKVLVIDDEPAICTALSILLEVHDIPCVTACSPEDGLNRLDEGDIGLIIHDMNFTADTTSGGEGVELFRVIKARDPDLPVLLMTAWSDLETAVQLVKEGADDYISKPWDDEKLIASVRDLLQVRARQHENAQLRASSAASRQDLEKKYDLCGLIYRSDEMHRVVSLALRVAPSDAPVLITGPNGSGKEKLAELVQANSARSQQPFVTVNAGGLPDELLEAELFGAEAGAYTGAKKRRLGRFEAANGGTLFLDEIGNLSHGGQMKLLRVLQTGEFQRLGSNETHKVDVRIVSATNADLPAAIREGTFREDLYYRLGVIELKIPPLAERQGDILPLAESFLREFSPVEDDVPWTFEDDARAALQSHPWPGNVRELRNRVRRAVLIAAGRVISVLDLDLAGATDQPSAASAPGTSGSATARAAGSPGETDDGDDAARREIEAAIVEAGGVMSRAAAILGISRQALYRRVDKLGIVIERRPVRPK